MMRLACGALAVCLAWTPAVPAAGYQIYGVRAGTRVVAMKWARMPVRYHVTDRSGGSVSAAQLQQAVGRAFSSWQQVATSSASADFVGFTSADPFDDDGMVTLGFMSRPDLERVLGATNFLVDDVTGEIVESDIFFNSAFPWSVSSGGESGRYDLESIALHEIGHLFGLGHSALGETELRTGGGRRVIAAESVMFPIAFSAGSTAERAPRADDIAGLSELYPDGGFEQTTGMIQGHITQDGRGVFGAHVVAFNPATGKLTGAFTVDGSGSFGIRGLDPGLHILRVEPVDDADLDSFFDQPEDVDLNFPVTYFDRYVAVPKGGASEMAEVAVTRLTGVAPAPVTTTVRNPTSIEFGASADHDGRLPEGRAMVERYLIEIYPRGGEESVLRASIGKPAPGADGVVRLDLSSSVPGWPPQTGIYEARVVAWGPAGVGRSEASNAFSIGTIVDERRSAPPESGDETAAVGGDGAPPPSVLARGWSWLGGRAQRASARLGVAAGLAVTPAQPSKPPVRPGSRPVREPGRGHSFEVATSYAWMAGSSIGSRDATLTRNQAGSSPLVYFKTAGNIEAAGGLDLRLGYRFTRRLGVQATAGWWRPSVGLRITSDYEGAPPMDVAGERLHQFLIGGEVVFRPFGGSKKPLSPPARPPATPPARPTSTIAANQPPRTSLFLTAGGGYLRHLHESRTLVEVGHYWQAGAGLDYLIRRRPLLGTSGVSLRGEARFYGVSGGTSFSGSSRTVVAAGAGLVFHF